MASDLVADFAECRRGVVVAPAGCGKTHLIAESVATSVGRQLILTHTHAGVRSLLNHLKKQRVPSNLFRVCTIDGFALRYASSFPGISNWTVQHPQSDEWRVLRLAAVKTLERMSVRRVVACSYAGFFVDEYQDCTEGQHLLIQRLLAILPGRVVGDPMQAIFRRLNKDDHAHWRLVDECFDHIGELELPHRWKEKNEELGGWLLDVRKRLQQGQSIDLRSSPVKWVEAKDNSQQLAVCKGLLGTAVQSALGLQGHRNQCYRLARNLKGRFRSMETVECEDLLQWCNTLQSATGIDRARCFCDFAKACLANLPSPLTKWVEKLRDGETPRTKRNDYGRVVQALKRITESNDLRCVGEAVQAIDALDDKPVLGRGELWAEMRRAIREHAEDSTALLSESAWHLRNRSRHIGRRVDHRCLSTTLLVKGLEFDHVAILNAADHLDAEDLYVAMTRGSRSLTVISEKPVLQRSLPHFVDT